MDPIKPGSSRVEDFFAWMGKRHEIWCKRDKGLPRPWTTDPILHEYKFTNVFRELDRGTIALRKMEERHVDLWDVSRRRTPDWKTAGLIVWNTFWYRMFNLDIHAKEYGFSSTPDTLYSYIRYRYRRGLQLYTGAHMTNGGDTLTPKHEAHIPVIQRVWEERETLARTIYESMSIRTAFEELRLFRYCGPFIAYEMASDLRWSVLFEPVDCYEWANVGPGCRRGMIRLGYEPNVGTMILLWARAKKELPLVVRRHHPLAVKPDDDPLWPPFELREIEHCLCEFDKYERVRLGQGKTRSRYADRKTHHAS